MGKWAQRLARENLQPITGSTAKTAERGVLSVLAVTPEWVAPKLQPANDPARACTDCQHLLRPGTCAEPVAAGLVESFGIVWPPAGYASTCASYTGKAPSKAQDRPHKLTPAGADTCHANGWDDADISRFQSRAAVLRRLGMTGDDAEDVAERLTLRDRQQDDRVMCCECQHYRPGRCGNHKAAGLSSMEVARDTAALLQRCPGFETMR